jgi:hypothetical protein
MLPAIAGMTDTCHHAQLFLSRRGLAHLYSLECSSTAVFLISGSLIARITGLSQQCIAKFYLYIFYISEFSNS